MPDPSSIQMIEEPYVAASIMVPTDFVGAVMKIAQDKRGTFVLSWLNPNRTLSPTAPEWFPCAKAPRNHSGNQIPTRKMFPVQRWARHHSGVAFPTHPVPCACSGGDSAQWYENPHDGQRQRIWCDRSGCVYAFYETGIPVTARWGRLCGSQY